jgi:hypothetical protein
LLQRCLERQRAIAGLPPKLPGGIGELDREDRAQPGAQLNIGLAAELVLALMSFQQFRNPTAPQERRSTPEV